MTEKLSSFLDRPVDGSSLSLFRITFGFIMFWEVVSLWSKVEYLFLQPKYLFPTWIFDFVEPWPGIGIYVHLAVMGLAAIGVLLGFRYRVSALLFFVGLSYLFLLDKTQFLNNHAYLMLLMSLIMIFVDAHVFLALDQHRRDYTGKQTVPFWNLLLLRAQLIIVYVYGGVRKINADWLASEPMSGSRQVDLISETYFENLGGIPLLDRLFTVEGLGFLISYSGLVFDLSIGFLLLWKRTFVFAFGAVFVFHALNTLLFSIGVFPPLMLASLVLFFPPESARNLLSRRKGSFPAGEKGVTRGGQSRLWKRRTTHALVSVYLAFQLLFPLRPYLYPGNFLWTFEGSRFSWDMMLRGHVASIEFMAGDGETGETSVIDICDDLTVLQIYYMSHRPRMIWQYANHIADQLRTEGIASPVVRGNALVSLNGRSFQHLIDPEVNLAEVDYPFLSHAPWIVPLKVNRPGGGFPRLDQLPLSEGVCPGDQLAHHRSFRMKLLVVRDRRDVR